MASVIERIIEVAGQDFDSPNCRVNNPRITARESIELANYIVDLKDERDALAAQVEAIAKDRDDWKNAMARAASVLLLHKVPTKNIDVDKALAEIRAEAGRAGYIAGVDDRACDYMDPQQVQKGADEYAAKMRQGGEQ